MISTAAEGENPSTDFFKFENTILRWKLDFVAKREVAGDRTFFIQSYDVKEVPFDVLFNLKKNFFFAPALFGDNKDFVIEPFYPVRRWKKFVYLEIFFQLAIFGWVKCQKGWGELVDPVIRFFKREEMILVFNKETAEIEDALACSMDLNRRFILILLFYSLGDIYKSSKLWNEALENKFILSFIRLFWWTRHPKEG